MKKLDLIYCVDKELDLIVITDNYYFQKEGVLNDFWTEEEHEELNRIANKTGIFEFGESIFEYDGDLEKVKEKLEEEGVEYSSELSSFIN
jgi:hypothetical protein